MTIGQRCYLAMIILFKYLKKCWFLHLKLIFVTDWNHFALQCGNFLKCFKQIFICDQNPRNVTPVSIRRQSIQADSMLDCILFGWNELQGKKKHKQINKKDENSALNLCKTKKRNKSVQNKQTIVFFFQLKDSSVNGFVFDRQVFG